MKCMERDFKESEPPVIKACSVRDVVHTHDESVNLSVFQRYVSFQEFCLCTFMFLIWVFSAQVFHLHICEGYTDFISSTLL